MPDSIFTRIIKGEVPSYKIYEDERVICFLNIRPVTPGHCLVVPKKQIDAIWDLDDEAYLYLWGIAKKVAIHMQQTLGTDRIGVVVKGFDVPHVHIHLIPVNRHSGTSLDPHPEPSQADEAALAEMANKLRLP